MAEHTISGTVWLSHFPTDSTRQQNFASDVWLKDEDLGFKGALAQACAKPLGWDQLPNEMYSRDPKLKADKLPDLFNGGGFFVMSEALKDVFQQHDIGQTSFKPVRLFAHDRTTPLPGAWYTINFAETKDTFLPDKSPGTDAINGIDGSWSLSGRSRAEHGVVALAPAALGGVDFWKEHSVARAFFFSDRLAEALKEAKLAMWFRLKRCLIDQTALH